MSKPGKDMQTLFASARGIEGPDNAALWRVLDRISATDPNLPIDPRLDPHTPASATPAWLSTVVGKLGLVAGAAVAVAAVGLLALQPARPVDKPSSTAAAVAIAELPPTNRAGPVVQPRAGHRPDPTPTERTKIENPIKTDDPLGPPQPAKDRNRAKRRGKAPSVHAPVRPHGDLDDELARIGLARTSLGQKRPGRALQVIAEYRKRYPRGELKHEARVIEVLSLCELGQLNHAREHVAKLRRMAGDVYVDTRLRGSCVQAP